MPGWRRRWKKRRSEAHGRGDAAELLKLEQGRRPEPGMTFAPDAVMTINFGTGELYDIPVRDVEITHGR